MSLWRAIRKYLGHPLQTPKQEAAEQVLKQRNRLDTLQQALTVQGWAEMQAMENARQAAWYDRVLFDGQPVTQRAVSEMGDLVVADHYTRANIQPPPVLPWLVALLAAAAAVAAGVLAWSKNTTPTEPVTEAAHPHNSGAVKVESQPLKLRVRWWVDEKGQVRYEVTDHGK